MKNSAHYNFRFATATRFSLALLLLYTLFACTSTNTGATDNKADADTISMKYASHLTISEKPHYTEVTVRNPWDTLKTLRRYLLIPRDSLLPADLPQGTVVRTPVRKALVYSSVHTGLISELGAVSAIAGVCSPEYITDPEVQNRIASNQVAVCGMSENPDMEKIIGIHPDLILLSPYENNDNYSKIEQLGIPVFECADYMETSPLGRAEWVRLYGLLLGVRDNSEKLFAQTEKEYDRLRQLAASSGSRPVVLLDTRYGQTWHVPTANSTMGRLIEDAAGKNPFSDFRQNGSVPLSPEKVLATAHDADIWLVRYYQDSDKTLSQLAADAPINSQFKAFKTGNVYGCNTRKVNLYEQTPFHPDRLLRDMVCLLHPDLADTLKAEYFKKMQ